MTVSELSFDIRSTEGDKCNKKPRLAGPYASRSARGQTIKARRWPTQARFWLEWGSSTRRVLSEVWGDYHRLWPVQPTTISPLDTKNPTLKPSDHPRTSRPAAVFESNPLPVTTYVINATWAPVPPQAFNPSKPTKLHPAEKYSFDTKQRTNKYAQMLHVEHLEPGPTATTRQKEKPRPSRNLDRASSRTGVSALHKTKRPRSCERGLLI